MPKTPRPHRLPTQRQRFTPSSPLVPSPQSYLLFFRDTNERFIVQKTSIKRINGDHATVQIGSKQRSAEVEAQGTFSLCQNILEEKLKAMDEEANANITRRKADENIDVSDNEGFDDLTNHRSVLHKQLHVNTSFSPPQLAQAHDTRSISPLSYLRSPQRSSPKGQRKHRRSPTMDSDEVNETQLGNVSGKQTATTDAVESTMMYTHMDNLFSSMMKTTERHLQHIHKKIDRLANSNMFDQTLDCFREKGEDFPKQVMYEQEDLLKIRAKDYGAYARMVLRKLFSPDELTTSILPPGGEQYRRPPLDPERFEYFHQALAAKYRIATVHYDDFYAKLLRPKLTDFLIDERKRSIKRNQQHARPIATNQQPQENDE